MLILGWISEGIIGAGLWIVSGIYHVAAFVFELFLILATGQLVDASSYETIITNVYIILGIVMLFALAFSLLRGMVNPDDQKQGASYVKKVIINLITSTIIMAVLPTIFTFAYDFQDAIITEQNTIGKFFGYGGSGSNDTPTEQSNLDKVKQGAYQIVNGVWTAFFNINSDYCVEFLQDEGEDPSTMTSKEQITYCQENIIAQESSSIDGMSGDYSFDDSSTWVDKSGSFGVYGSFAGNIDDNELDFNFLLAMIGGIILIFVGVSYCFDMAVRLVKLVFLQLIAPLPIFFRIIPDNNLGKSFGNWTKKTLACYLEVYVRIIVFYFVIYLCNEMIKSNFLGNEIYEYGWFLAFLAKAFVLIGLITFMRSAPKLLSEVTGIDSGNIKLGIREKLAEGGVFTAGAIAGGALTTGVRNLTNAGQNVKNKYKENRDAGKGKFKSALGATGTAVRGLGSVVGGTVSGGVRSGKSGLGAKSFGDMKGSATKGATAAVNARDKRATYRANHGGTLGGVIAGHTKDAVRGLGEWAGVGVVTSTEADWFSSGANAFDSAHSQMESAYKGKPEHNKIKERITELTGETENVNNQIKQLENIVGPLTEEQTRHLSELRQRLTVLNGELASQKAFKSQHEATEMTKKMSLQMEAINGLVNAKMKYVDMSNSIFNDDMYNILKDSMGRGDSDEVKNLINKIQNNQTISMSDLKREDGSAIIDMNTLEKFVDQVGIKAKDMAAEKRVEVAHARALKDEKKSDGK